MLTACSPASRDEKNRGKKQETMWAFFYPRGEEKKEKQTKLRMNVRNVYIWV